jgi:Ca-activated chloride channel family protein
MFTMSMSAQSDRNCIRLGNRAFHAKKWTQAEVLYRKALSKNNQNSQAMYNLGCALMMQQKDSLALKSLGAAGKMENCKSRRAMCYHNMGVIQQGHQQYAQAIEAYKMALRDNPNDNQTRYNLALCKKLLKNQPKNQNKNKNQNKKDKKKQQQKQQQKEQQKQQQQQKKLSKDNAEQLLNAAIQQEQATKQRIQQNMRQPSSKQLEQNW